jgi:phospholipid/cholesterol/gamma-HCH transport system permease protein
MESHADFHIDDESDDRRIVLTGEWSAIGLGDAGVRLRDLMRSDFSPVDLNVVDRFDTAGAMALIDATSGQLDKREIEGRPETLRLLDRVVRAIEAETYEYKRPLSFNAMMARLGEGLIKALAEMLASLGYLGRLMATTGSALLNPTRVRWPTVVNIIERAGIDAIPIVMISNFFIGAVIAFLAASMLADFGIQVFAVETVGFGVLREFAVVITAVLIAGRSASSFAAEIGSMKMQQEIDAMRTMGVDPFEAVVLPRFLALLVMMFLLTFLAAIAGLFGGALVLWWTLDLSPMFFLQRIQDSVGVSQFGLSMLKAPFMAMTIAAIGCRQGLMVGGDVESLGRRVTTAVVHSVFAIIVLDAIFALIFLELEW